MYYNLPLYNILRLDMRKWHLTPMRLATLNMHAHKSRTDMCLGLIKYLHLRTYFVYLSSEDSDECTDAQARLNFRWSHV